MPQRLSAAAPSTIALLHECAYRVALSQGRGGNKRSTPWARLGTASHAVLAHAISGHLGKGSGGFDERFNKAWEDAIEAESQAANVDPIERLWGLPHRWPTYADRKLRTKRLALQLSKERATWVDPDVIVERRLQSEDRTIYGTPDVVVRQPPPHRVEDFKTGVVLDDEGTLRDRYRRQLLIYAYLEREDRGSLPAQGVVRPLRGPAVAFDISDRAVDAEVRAAISAIEAFNAALPDPHQLARPSTTTCRTCPHTGRCEPFWTMIRDAPAKELIGVGGIVTATHSTEGHGIAAHVVADEGNAGSSDVAVRGIPTPLAAWLSSSEPGQRVRIVGLAPVGGTAASFAPRGMLRVDRLP